MVNQLSGKLNETVDRVKADMEKLKDVAKVIAEVEDISARIKEALAVTHALQEKVLGEVRERK